MMRRTMAALLLATTAMAPMTAGAQGLQGRGQGQSWQNNGQDHQRGDRHPGRGEDRGGTRPDRGSGTPATPVETRQPQSGAQWQSRGGYGAPGRPVVRDGTRPHGEGGRDTIRVGSAPGNPDVRWQNPRPENSRPQMTPRRDDKRDRWNRNDRRADGVWNDRNWNDRRGNDRRWDDHRWSANSDVWNRGWRNDRRYDWQGYRYGNRHIYRLPRYYGPRGYDYRRWAYGYRLPPYYYVQSYWIDDPWYYRLPPPYGPYRWVRYYDDVLLVDITNGLIQDILYSFFWH